MSKIKIEAEINVADVSHVEALNVFLKAIGGHYEAKEQAPVKTMQVVDAQEVDPPNQDEQAATEKPELGDPSTWSDTDMKTIEVKDLKKVCNDLGIDFEAVDGMNTNAKLRRLILQHFQDAGSSTEVTKEAGAPKETPSDAGGPAEGTNAPAGEAKTGPTRDDVRIAIRPAMADHREVLKEKLSELGANNVSSLKEEHFQEMLDFIDTL